MKQAKQKVTRKKQADFTGSFGSKNLKKSKNFNSRQAGQRKETSARVKADNFDRNADGFDRNIVNHSALAMSDQREERDDRLKGRNAINAALTAGRQIDKIWLNKAATFDIGLQRLLAKAKAAGVVIVETDAKALIRLAGDNHQGIVAQVAVKDYLDLDELLARDLKFDLASLVSETTCKKESVSAPELVIMLDQIQDPHNLGAVLRVADALNVTAIIVPKHRAASLDATVARTSAGAIEHVPCCRVTNLANTIKRFKEAGYWVIGADMQGENLYRSQTFKTLASDKLVLVIGNEGKGISQLVKAACDLLVQIPMYGQVNSLNASVASAIIAYEIARLRQ